jgi:hypothetical protein
MMAALKALHDCGVVRSRIDHPGYLELWKAGLVITKTTPPDPSSCTRWDFSLNARGKVVANIKFGGSN